MLIWYGAGAVAAIVIAWLAALVHASGHAPFGLVSLAVGIFLGAALARIAGTLRVPESRRHRIIGTILLAITAVLAEHAWLYSDFRRQWHESREKSPQVAMFRPAEPPSPAEYFRDEATTARAILWCADALLTVASAVGTFAVLTTPSSPQAPFPNP
jgi:ABC-type uncharacterized transport system permease subunit